MKLLKFLAIFLAIVPMDAQTPEVDAVLDKAARRRRHRPPADSRRYAKFRRYQVMVNETVK